MKKFIFLIIIFFSLIGCTLDDIDNTPTKQVEAFFNNYQKLNDNVISVFYNGYVFTY